MASFDYFTAFQRNIGFLSRQEQELVRGARVAIAGLGGTGGAQVHALARIGVGRFTLADLDTYELANFNRQLGATMHTIGHPKVDVATEIIHAINPEADVRQLTAGIGPESIATFLEEADLVIDSLDFYCFKERFLLYAEARKRGLWVLTAPPLGFGFTLLFFDPDGMSFMDYFGFKEGMSQRDLTIALFAGIAPRPYMLKYLNMEGLDFGAHRLPSVGAAPFLIAGVMATETVKRITGKGKTLAAPTIQQYDAMLNKFNRRTYPMGMRSPLQRFKKLLISKRMPA
ncbi:MAG: ThiF family adenylyltransferase [Chromatiaceae bacterium]|nr:ThiF family adenylyltransferase [Chromatiaceae bacterium]